MMKYLALLLIALTLTTSAGAQNLIKNGTFDVNNPGSGFFCGPVYSWISGGGGVQWENQWNNNGDGWWVDITGCGWGNDHWIEQTINTKPGNQYTLEFDLGCWNGQYFTTGGTDLYINGNFIANYEYSDFSGDRLAWKKFSYCFKTDGTLTTIRFVGRGEKSDQTPDWCYPINNYVGVIGLDNVSVKEADGKIEHTSYCAPTVLKHHSEGGFAYWWSAGLGFVGGDSLLAQNPGTYTLYYQTECGLMTDQIVLGDCKDTCWMSPDFYIGKSPEPADSTILCAGDYAYFHGFSNTNIALLYAWNFGDGTGANYSLNPSASHKYVSPGYYTVCMTAWLAPSDPLPAYCAPYTICKTIYVKDCSEKPTEGDTGEWPSDPGGGQTTLTMGSDAPLIISPNPVSDELTIHGPIGDDKENASVKVQIYDLSGKLLIEKEVSTERGEAKLSVQELKAGVYILKLQGSSYDGELRFIRK